MHARTPTGTRMSAPTRVALLSGWVQPRSVLLAVCRRHAMDEQTRFMQSTLHLAALSPVLPYPSSRSTLSTMYQLVLTPESTLRSPTLLICPDARVLTGTRTRTFLGYPALPAPPFAWPARELDWPR